MIFKPCIETGRFSSDWKKANIFLAYKKVAKQVFKNYCPIPLLPICGKLFERLIFNKMFEFFIDIDLVFPNQSRFTPLPKKVRSCLERYPFIIG